MHLSAWALLLTARPTVAMFGNCFECEQCVEHCGRKCAKKVFQDVATRAPQQLDSCCAAHIDGDGTTYCTPPPAECKRNVTEWKLVAKYNGCRQRCDNEFEERYGSYSGVECCYEIATYACGEILTMGFLEDAQSSAHEECFKLANLFANCPPAGGGSFEYDMYSKQAELHVDPRHRPSSPRPAGSPYEENTCIAEPTTAATGCWNEYGTDEYFNLTRIMQDPASPEIERMYKQLVYWMKVQFLEAQMSPGGLLETEGRAADKYLLRFAAHAKKRGRWDIIEDKAFKEILKMPLEALDQDLGVNAYSGDTRTPEEQEAEEDGDAARGASRDEKEL